MLLFSGLPPGLLPFSLCTVLFWVTALILHLTKEGVRTPSRIYFSNDSETPVPLVNISKYNEMTSRETRLLNVTIPETMTPPVFLYYEIETFYQNHRQFVRSFSYRELNKGQRETKVCGTQPLDDQIPSHPCGIKAKTVFLDRFLLERPEGPIPIDRNSSRLTLKADQDTYKNRIEDGAELPSSKLLSLLPPSECVKFPSAPASICTNTNQTYHIWVDGVRTAFTCDAPDKIMCEKLENRYWCHYEYDKCNTEDAAQVEVPNFYLEAAQFMNWMRPGICSSLTKLYGVIDETLHAGDQLMVEVFSHFNPRQIQSKSFFFSNTHRLANTLEYILWTAGLLCFGSIFLFLPRKLWKGKPD